MGRSLFLSFIILSTVFYVMGRPKEDTGKIDYFGSVKSHDFSTKAVEQRFYNALKPDTPNGFAQSKTGLTRTSERRIHSLAPKSLKAPLSPVVSPAKIAALHRPEKKTAPLFTAPQKKPVQTPKIFHLPTYFSLKKMVESTITHKDLKKTNTLASNSKGSVKVARLTPNKREDGLMDFAPLDHVYTPPKSQPSFKAIEKTAHSKTVTTVALAKPPKKPAMPRPLYPALEPLKPVMIALPIKKVAPTPKPILLSKLSLPQQAPRAHKAPIQQKRIVVSSAKQTATQSLDHAEMSPKKHQSAPSHAAKTKPNQTHQARKKRIAARKWRLQRKKKLRLLRAKQYALRKRRNRNLMRQLQAKLQRRRNRRAPTNNYVTKKKAKHYRRLASLTKGSAENRRQHTSIRRKKITRKSKFSLKKRLRLQRQKAAKSYRQKIRKRRNRRVASLSRQQSNRLAVRQSRLKKEISSRNKKIFQKKLRQRKKRTNYKSKNKRILRLIDKKLDRKKKRRRLYRKKTIIARTKIKRRKKKRFVRQALRRRVIRRKTRKKARVRRTRIARRRPRYQRWNVFSLDGSLGGDF